MAIALVGRPNVGKSSLFNFLTQSRRALVWDRPGVTRDLIRGVCELSDGRSVEIWDLAGWTGNEGAEATDLQRLSKETLNELSAAVFVVDGSAPLTANDFECLQHLRKTGIPFCVLVNKSDKTSFRDHSHEILEFVQEHVFLGSIERRDELEPLVDFIAEYAPAENEENQSGKRIVILGRPNVGKSSLIQTFLKDSEAGPRVSNQPGTTRDATEWSLSWKGSDYILVDTAGVRKKGNIHGRGADPVEIFSVDKALQAMKKSDLCLLVIEAHPNAQLTTQDKKLLSLVRETLIPTILIVNKWDLVRKDWNEKEYREEVKYHLQGLDYLPILFVSAKTGFRTKTILQALENLLSKQKQIATSKLNKWLQNILKRRAPRIAKKGVGKARPQFLHFNYIVQTGTTPMSFQIFCNAPKAVADDEKKYLERELRETFHLTGYPIRLLFRSKS